MMKKTVLLVAVAMMMTLLLVNVAFAHEGHPEHTDFEQAEAIINAEISCDQLSDEQLEMIGEYYMERMHPGEQHVRMDEVMGGEGSANLRQMHINMAYSMYCEESRMMGSGMMRMMAGVNAGTAGPCTEDSCLYTIIGGENMMDGYGMMSGAGWFGMSLLWLVYVALVAFVFGIVFWWTQKLVMGKKKS